MKNVDHTLLPWQQEFLYNTKKIKILSGSAGTGKSDVCRNQIVFNCIEAPQTSCMVAARGYDNAVAIIVKPLLGFLREKNIEYTLKTPKGKNEKLILFANGSQIDVFSTTDLMWKLKGREYHSIFIDEAVNIPALHFDKVISQCLTRIRTTQEIDRQIPVMQLLLATNPGMKSHPLYRNYLLNPPKNTYARHVYFHEGWYQDNQDYKDTLENLSPIQRAIYYEGEWGALEGQVFRFNTFKNPAPEVNHGNRFHISFDYGFSPDPMIYLLIENTGSTLIVREELELKEVPISKHGNYLDEWFDKYQISAFTGETATGSGEIRDLLQNKYQLSYYPTRKMRQEGWTTLVDLFERNCIILDNVTRCVESLESLQWMLNKMDIMPGDDHHADALRYYVMSSLYAGRSPFQDAENVKITISQTPKGRGRVGSTFAI